MKRVVVVGGGISGLSAAYYVQTKAAASGVTIATTLLEASPRFGGKISTLRQDGFVIEGGPDSFLTQKPWALELCRELGLTDRLLATRESQARTSVLIGGRLVELPEGAVLGVPTRIAPFLRSPLISWSGKLRMGLDLVIPPRRERDDESLASFVRRRLGPEALDKIAEPLMAGIHVADPERLSLQATFPRFAELERSHGSLIRGLRRQGGASASGGRKVAKPSTTSAAATGSSGRRGEELRRSLASSPFLSFQEGMQELVGALLERLKPVSLLSGRRAVRLSWRDANPPIRSGSNASAYELLLDDGSAVTADAVVLATPADVAATLVSGFNPALATLLSCIRYVSTATISLGYRRADVLRPLDGFGFVVPRREKRRISACTCSSTKFDGRAPSDCVLLRAFVGGVRDEAIVDLDDEALVNAVRMDLEDTLRITGEPIVAEVFRWRKGIPQYDVGHLDRVAALDRLCSPGLFLAGAAYRGVGVPDCIRSGKEVAEKVVEYVTVTQNRSRAGAASVDGGC